ncbi:hypothetical protein M514_04138 [Trichuris suis]|uniref:Uncharacterized protein n=1 Tax=Trichuris suis TaxID=68888 RepID=A0A085MCL0_9BILA|nr:hypothetical protein M513_04138 [Trichuris suis]KFD68432.1 hypothetical protein M514_04138 [Trichuris suis]
MAASSIQWESVENVTLTATVSVRLLCAHQLCARSPRCGNNKKQFEMSFPKVFARLANKEAN